MTTIPFDLAKFKAGYKPIYRNGEEPLEVHYFEKAIGYKVISINPSGSHITHSTKGHYYLDETDSANDLLLIELDKIEEWWGNVYPKVGHIYNDIDPYNRNRYSDLLYQIHLTINHSDGKIKGEVVKK